MNRHTYWPITLLSLLLLLVVGLLGANLWRMSRPVRPDPQMVGLAVRATLFALPTPTVQVVEVTRIVTVTVAVPTATLTPVPTATPTLTPTLVPTAEAPLPTGDTTSPATDVLAAAAGSEDGQRAAVAEAEVAAPAVEAPPPPPDATFAVIDAGACPAASERRYITVPVAGGGLDHPDREHADLNLTLRGYAPVDVALALFDKDGPVDSDPPQLAGIFADYRRPEFAAAGRVYDWDWGCGVHGCRRGLLDHVAATYLLMRAAPGEPIGVPHRNAQIYGGGYKALVLYAEPTRITLGYTRDDSVANGYAVHLEGLCVDPNLVALYASSTAAGRGFLPALREDEVLGMALQESIGVAVRDRGVFFDPRSRLDWWQGF